MPIRKDRRGGQRSKSVLRHRVGGLSADHLNFIGDKPTAELKRFADKDDRLPVSDAAEVVLAMLEREVRHP
jgi:hypothetical protein